VGETTRVLLRRVPWQILARADAGDELSHVRLLAAERGVPVVEGDFVTKLRIASGLFYRPRTNGSSSPSRL
jgi:hypothetical protein